MSVKYAISKNCNFFKKEALAQVFSYEVCKIKNTFFTEHIWTTASAHVMGMVYKWDQDPGTQDLGTLGTGTWGPPQSLKVGPQDPLQSLKVGHS